MIMWVTEEDTKSSVVVYWPQGAKDIELESVHEYGKQWHYEIAAMDYVSPAIHGGSDVCEDGMVSDDIVC